MRARLAPAATGVLPSGKDEPISLGLLRAVTSGTLDVKGRSYPFWLSEVYHLLSREGNAGSARLGDRTVLSLFVKFPAFPSSQRRKTEGSESCHHSSPPDNVSPFRRNYIFPALPGVQARRSTPAQRVRRATPVGKLRGKTSWERTWCGPARRGKRVFAARLGAQCMPAGEAGWLSPGETILRSMSRGGIASGSHF